MSVFYDLPWKKNSHVSKLINKDCHRRTEGEINIAQDDQDPSRIRGRALTSELMN